MPLSAEQIAEGKKRTKYGTPKDVLHEHDDCIRVAYEWLDAQVKTKSSIKRALPMKHIIEKWAGRYVSMSDVEVAATLHPEIRGDYPRYNISSRLTLPSERRLSAIDEAHKHGTTPDPKRYSRRESDGAV